MVDHESLKDRGETDLHIQKAFTVVALIRTIESRYHLFILSR